MPGHDEPADDQPDESSDHRATSLQLPRRDMGAEALGAIMHAMSTESRVPVVPSAQGAASSWGLGRRSGDPVGVCAGARGARHRHAQGALRAVHRRARGPGVGWRDVRHRGPGHRARPRARREGHRRPTSTRPFGPRGAPAAGRWGNLPGRERAKYLFRIARILQERSREFAVLESMDSGKPIKESRDVDVPLAAAHFWYYAGLGGQARVRVPRADRAPRSASPPRSSRGTSRC